MSRKLIAQQPTAIVKPLMAWFRGTAERRTLADMPDYVLKDIGLRRDQLPGLADEVAAGLRVLPRVRRVVEGYFRVDRIRIKIYYFSENHFRK